MLTIAGGILLAAAVLYFGRWAIIFFGCLVLRWLDGPSWDRYLD